MEKKYIYILLTKGTDGKFTMNSFQTQEDAQKTLDMYIEAQKEIEGLGDSVYVDRHKHERLRLPEFVMKDDDILTHVTVNYIAHFDGKDRMVQTDRYIIRVEIG